jgi:hypothetical protein
MELDFESTLLDLHKRNGNSSSNFIEDFNRFRTIEILINKHHKYGSTNYKLLVNYVIIQMNVFGNDGAMYGFSGLISEENEKTLNSILIYTQRATNVPFDEFFLAILETL